MCTALTLKNKTTNLFGRNMDIHSPFHQSITIVSRRHIWPMRFMPSMEQKYAMIGMATPYKDVEHNVPYPLFAEAANEKGLAVASLYFPEIAYYPEPGEIPGAFELAPFEVIQWVLANFASTNEVEQFFRTHNVKIVNQKISINTPIMPLHFIIADKYGRSIVIEPCKDGLKIHENIIGVLTNCPTFDWHMLNLSFYQNLGTKQLKNVNWSGLNIKPHGQGFASFGLPGDWTPASRFVKTAFLKSITSTELSDSELLTQFFHILDSVAMVKGSIIIEDKQGDIHEDNTLYSSCIDLDNCIYYYKSYSNNQINAFMLQNENLDSDQIIIYPFNQEQAINYVNKK